MDYTLTASRIKEKDFILVRGDRYSLEFEYPGEDFTESSLMLVAKADLELTSDRLIERSGVNITVELVADKSVILVDILPVDTADLEQKYLYYDLVVDDEKTIYRGKLKLKPDVQTPTDGTSLPSGATRIIVVRVEEGSQNNDVIMYDVTDSVWKAKTLDEMARIIAAANRGPVRPTDWTIADQGRVWFDSSPEYMANVTFKGDGTWD